MKMGIFSIDAAKIVLFIVPIFSGIPKKSKKAQRN
jgi:hypothetical protein